MTDQLETDLRSMLARRASSATADPERGERAIESRLVASEVGLAEPLMHEWRRRRFLMAAAVVLVVAVGATLALTGRYDRVNTGPAAGAGPTTTLLPVGAMGRTLRFDGVVAERPVPCVAGSGTPSAAVGCFDLRSTLVPGSVVLSQADAEEQPDGTWAVRLSFLPDASSLVSGLVGSCLDRDQRCPSGRLAIVIDEVVVSSPTITDPSFAARGIQITGYSEVEARTLARDLTATALSERDAFTVVPPVDYTIGTTGESAKDLAERFMRELLGDESVTTGVEDDADVTLVTMETSTGATVVAQVIFDAEAEAFRLTSVASPGVMGEVTADGELFVQLPEAGTLKVRGFSEDFTSELDATAPGGVRLDAGRQGPLPQPPPDHVWWVLRLENGRGQVLWAFSRE